MQIAALKGMVAGLSTVVLASVRSAIWPSWLTILVVGLLGLISHGISLVLFVRALRELGASFLLAPFMGALISIPLLGDPATGSMVLAGVLMGAGVGLHVTEHHAHTHQHDEWDHDHQHLHDEHHDHVHDGSIPETEPHAHPHHHDPMLHSHPYFPDLHHRHSH